MEIALPIEREVELNLSTLYYNFIFLHYFDHTNLHIPENSSNHQILSMFLKYLEILQKAPPYQE